MVSHKTIPLCSLMSLIQLDLNTSVDQIAAYSLIRDVFAAALSINSQLETVGV